MGNTSRRSHSDTPIASNWHSRQKKGDQRLPLSRTSVPQHAHRHARWLKSLLALPGFGLFIWVAVTTLLFVVLPSGSVQLEAGPADMEELVVNHVDLVVHLSIHVASHFCSSLT